MRGLKHAVGWCQWSKKQAARFQGDFVEDRDNGYRLHRKIEGEKGPKEWTVFLGYRRETATRDHEDSSIAEDGNATDVPAKYDNGAAETDEIA